VALYFSVQGMTRRERDVVFALGMATGACTLTHDLDGWVGEPGVPISDAADARRLDEDAPVPNHDSAILDSNDLADSADGSDERYRAAVLSDAPLGYWRLGEATGTIAKDEMGANPGTYENNVVRAVPGAIAGTKDTAARFGQGHVTIGDVFDFTGMQPFAIEAWILYDHPFPAGGDFEQYFVAKLEATGGYHAYLDRNGRIGFDRENSGFDSVYAAFTVSNVFRHVVVTYDGSMSRIFVDGNLSSSGAGERGLPATPATLTIGAEPGTSGFFEGAIGEVAVYDHILDSTRIRAHFDIGKGN